MPALEEGLMEQSRDLFSFIVDLWRARAPSTYEQLMRVAAELRAINLSFNMQVMDLSPIDPFDFQLHILKKSVGIRTPNGATGSLTSTLGAYPDPDFYRHQVVPHYVAARDTGLIQVSSSSGRILDRIAAYDRLILPVKQRASGIKHALAIINIKGNFPAHSQVSLSVEEREVLSLLVNGIPTDEILIRRNCTQNQMDRVLDGIITNLRANTLAHAIAIAVAHDLVAPMEETQNKRTHLLRLDLAKRFYGALNEAIILVDENARIIYANSVATAIIADGDLRLRNDILWLQSPRETIALHGLVAQCAIADTRNARGYLAISRGWGRVALSLSVKPAPAAVSQHDPKLVMISIVDPDKTALPAPAQLQQQFGLTRMEVLVALEIAVGRGAQAAADRLGIGIGTVKTHLVRVFDKTHTSRQAELAKLLLAMRHLAT